MYIWIGPLMIPCLIIEPYPFRKTSVESHDLHMMGVVLFRATQWHRESCKTCIGTMPFSFHGIHYLTSWIATPSLRQKLIIGQT